MSDFERRKLVIEELLADYEKSLAAAVEWVNSLQKREKDKNQHEQKTA